MTVETTAGATHASFESFEDLHVSEHIRRAVEKMGWEKPSPIQALTLPALLDGADVVGVAQTGSGKTAAFSIPMIEGLNSHEWGVQALILVPTRELAAQTAEEIKNLSGDKPVKPLVVCGGMSMNNQITALKAKPRSKKNRTRPVQVVVGTPGRILDHLQRGTMDLSFVKYLALDEADRMLDMGFAPDVARILAKTPNERQTALFSATMPKEIKKIVERHMRSPKWMAVESKVQTVDTVEQVYYRVNGQDKIGALKSIIDAEEAPSAIIFRRTKRGATNLHKQLERQGYRAGLLHGGKTQAQRTKALESFDRGRTNVLVATNVASRGLDIPNVSHVINFDLPEDAETYVHRIGRTARAGKEGIAATLLTDSELREFNRMKKTLKVNVQESQLPKTAFQKSA
ncbi:DEAD/DEAH box helicase [Rubrobacter indicoceani]|uniref:DEAD/DEAH box helicase n=1 Tax=Rubrobacter indicoceani TaxID=2051957 RepID=UPI000E5B1550|nr:DEAD/DEAH box helicase [Rubrobacter indicoceani]